MATVTSSVSIPCTGSVSLRTFGDWGDRPYLMFNGDDVTDHGRKTQFSLIRSNVISVRRHTGVSKSYYPANSNKIKMSSSWSMLPDTSSNTTDGRSGRVKLKKLCDSRSEITLYIKKNDGSGYLSYNGYISSYNENLFSRRDYEGGVLYDIKMEFTEL
tara:strand:- start:3800 stop:4273 length:474 start_codon:yes stop_codon:yes gene_type:complete